MKRVKKDKKDEEDTIISQMNVLTKKCNMIEKWAIFSFLTKLLRQYRASGGQELTHKIFGTIDDVPDIISFGNAAIAYNYKGLDNDPDIQYKHKEIHSLKELVDIMHIEGLQICFSAVDNEDTLKKSLDLSIDYFPINCMW